MNPNNTPAIQKNTGKKITGKKVLLWMFSFFGVIFAVNGTFVYLALDTFPGLTTEQAYEEGLTINTTLAEAEAQTKIGWKSEPTLSVTDFQVRMVSKDTMPLTGLSIVVIFHRPLGEPYDIEIKLKEISDGLYLAPHALPLEGRWKAKISAIDPQGQTFKMTHELKLSHDANQ